MSYRMRNILIAVGLAGLAALAVTIYVSNYKKSVQHQQAAATVLVASKDIPVNTLGADVAKSMLTTRQVARDAVVAGAISSPDQIRSQVTTTPIFQGEQVSLKHFGPLVQQGVKGQLTGTQRAIQLAGDSNQVMAGTIQAGDYVDFVAVMDVHFSQTGSEATFSRIVVRDLKVIQTQNSAGSTHIGGGNGGSAIMLRVTDAQSQKIALAYKKSVYWALELRPGLKAADSPNSVETPNTLIGDGIDPSRLLRIATPIGGK